MAVRTTWRPALAWRMQRHLLNPVGTLSVARVVGRLCGVQAQVASSSELAVVARLSAILDRDLAEVVDHAAARK